MKKSSIYTLIVIHFPNDPASTTFWIHNKKNEVVCMAHFPNTESVIGWTLPGSIQFIMLGHLLSLTRKGGDRSIDFDNAESLNAESLIYEGGLSYKQFKWMRGECLAQCRAAARMWDFDPEVLFGDNWQEPVKPPKNEVNEPEPVGLDTLDMWRILNEIRRIEAIPQDELTDNDIYEYHVLKGGSPEESYDWVLERWYASKGY